MPPLSPRRLACVYVLAGHEEEGGGGLRGGSIGASRLRDPSWVCVRISGLGLAPPPGRRGPLLVAWRGLRTNSQGLGAFLAHAQNLGGANPLPSPREADLLGAKASGYAGRS
jgi:hypothetical protein